MCVCVVVVGGGAHRFCVLSEGWSSHELFHHGHDNLITVTVANIKEMYPVLVRLEKELK